MVVRREYTQNILTIQYHFKGKSNPRSQSLTLITKDNKVNRTRDSIYSNYRLHVKSWGNLIKKLIRFKIVINNLVDSSRLKISPITVLTR